MKQNNRLYRFFGWFAAASLLWTTSCQQSLDELDRIESDEVTVSFVLTPETLAGTRAIEQGDGTYIPKEPTGHISDGSKADVLIYAVYDEYGNIIPGYGKGLLSDDPDMKKFSYANGTDNMVKTQTVMKIKKLPVEISFTFKRDVDYTIAFWAQSSQTDAYDTRDLRKVEVKYSEIADELSSTTATNGSSTPNNDEFRDAFCNKVTIGPSGKEITNGKALYVYLYRPLAQINVGTNGFDYEIVTRDAVKKYTYSKIRINRVARYLDVYEDKVYHSTTTDDPNATFGGEKDPESYAVVDFGYAPIPAYIHPSFKNFSDGMLKAELLPSYTVWDWDHSDGEFSIPGNSDLDRDFYANEEFLYVHLDKEEATLSMPDVKEGFRSYANHNNYAEYKNAETFKYLSMCYVLTDSDKEVNDVINNVKVWLATDAEGTDEVEIVNINQVPAQRNWRTNIIGNLLTSEETFSVTLDRDFAGEYNGILDPDQKDGARWSGPLAEGVYYDGAADEIQISNAAGLIWFQRMVNGTMKVRKALSGKEMEDKDYPYYAKNTDGKYSLTDFVYNGINAPADNDLKERILKATHQDHNVNYKGGWPAADNFHFTGTTNDGKDYPAKVKLMADIDLSGIEWVPAGFDYKILETVNEAFEDSDAANRGFFGEFDGNGHTIYNLSTKRFSAKVPDKLLERDADGKVRYYDTPQWFGRGLFGEIGGNAKIRNVRLHNVDVFGCQGVGGVVGLAYGDKIEITNCIVDGGSLIVTPMYRGDKYTGHNQTFARGIYLGGIVGYFHTHGGRVENCEVRNLYMQGYRRVGGIIGSLGQKDMGTTEDGKAETDGSYPGTPKVTASETAAVSNNKITNTVIIASQFSTFGMMRFPNSKTNTVVPLQTGFGWSGGMYNLYANEIVGGHNKDINDRTDVKDNGGNTSSNLTLAEFTIDILDANDERVTSNDDAELKNAVKRIAGLQAAPLNHMPALSSLYADEITLHSNYYGEPSAYTHTKLQDFNVFSEKAAQTGYSANWAVFTSGNGYLSKGGNTFLFPINLPYETEITWDKESHRAGLYVESVTVDGIKGVGDRSVITPTGVMGEGDCVMYITARNRHQFIGDSEYKNDMKQPTVVKNVVLRGEPYADAGIVFAPNKNMSKITLDNVSVYDVYKTITTEDWTEQTNPLIWPNYPVSGGYDAGKNQGANVLEVINCNLRGYTVPGGNWGSIAYTGTTFEAGCSTGHDATLERTCEVETKADFKPTDEVPYHVTFEKCFFKAPYVIDLTKANLEYVNFDDCMATATSTTNKPININRTSIPVVKKIVVSKNLQGDPVITYYGDEDWQKEVEE